MEKIIFLKKRNVLFFTCIKNFVWCNALIIALNISLIIVIFHTFAITANIVSNLSLQNIVRWEKYYNKQESTACWQLMIIVQLIMFLFYQLYV